MAKFTVFHGSYTTVKEPKIRRGKNTKDFGVGFYCTVIREQAERWAKRYPTKILNMYSVNMRKFEGLKVKDFKEMTDEWLDFIISCRSGKPHDYDIVIGAMANDQIYNYITDYLEGAMTREQFWVLSKFKYPSYQIAFCTEKALESLEFISVDPKKNDIFLTCSLIDYIARKTTNKRAYVANKLGVEIIAHIFELADVYHSDNIERVADDFIEKAGIEKGEFDNVGDCKYTIPGYFDIGKVYMRFVYMLAEEENLEIPVAIVKAYNSEISDLIDDYNSLFYTDSPQNIFNAYLYGVEAY